MNRWVNFLSLLPGTSLTLLVISVAFLRVYDETDFLFLGYLANARLWSNRLTLAALLVALANFGVEWDRRNQETDRRAEEEQRRVEEEQRRVEEEQRRVGEEQQRAEAAERAARRARIQNRWIVLQARYLLRPTAEIEATIADFVQFLQEYGEL